MFSGRRCEGQQGCLVGGDVLEGLQDHWVVGGGDVLTIKTICMAKGGGGD